MEAGRREGVGAGGEGRRGRRGKGRNSGCGGPQDPRKGSALHGAGLGLLFCPLQAPGLSLGIAPMTGLPLREAWAERIREWVGETQVGRRDSEEKSKGSLAGQGKAPSPAWPLQLLWPLHAAFLEGPFLLQAEAPLWPAQESLADTAPPSISPGGREGAAPLPRTLRAEPPVQCLPLVPLGSPAHHRFFYSLYR